MQGEATASARLATVGRFGRRKARDAHHAASDYARTLRAQLRDTWGSDLPRTVETLGASASKVAARQADSEPRVSHADRQRAAQRARELHDPFARDPRRADPGRDGPARDL